MDVYEIKLKIYCLQNIPLSKVQSKISAMIDQSFAISQELLEFHRMNKYKQYVFDRSMCNEKNKIYERGKIYTFRIRTIDPKLARHFSEICPNQQTNELKGLVAEIRILPKKMIQTLYTLTPAILKDENGYWRSHMSLEQYENRLKVNLIKKWNAFQNEKIDEDFQFCTMLEFLNQKPIPVEYKNIKLLGDKIRLQIADNEMAQKLSYIALGVGVSDMNPRGFGFVNYRWL